MCKVLVADDAAMMRSRMAARLRILPGVQSVIESADSPSTLAMIAAEQPDFIVLDMFLPGGTGLDILHHLRNVGSLAQVIIHSAWPDDNLRRRSLDAGACGFFEKGSGSLDAIESINQLIRQKAARGKRRVVGHAAGNGSASVDQAPKRDAVVAAPAEAGAAAGGLTVLIVEDHEFQRKTMVRLLKGLGVAQVLEAEDGLQAIAMLASRAHAIQLIICDLDMPNMDGMEFMRRFAESGTRAGLVINSAQDLAVLNSVETMCQAYGVRPLGVIEKPATRDVLTSLLNRLQEASLGSQPSASASPTFEVEAILEGIRCDQFEAFYQPKCELASGRIIGAEALARWRHPDCGLLAPWHFIERLEASGNIDSLTFPMIEAAARACHRWHSLGLRLGVSVNLSLTSLGDTTLAARLIHAVRGAGLDPRHMTLEITETAAMTKIAPALENLARLRMHGFGLSIDDFGTGFASMEQLSRIAFTELKIDGRFVSKMTSRREANAIVASSIDIGRRLGIVTIAEGVETQAQWDALKAADCLHAQGYLISRPVEDENFIRLCQQR